MRALVDKDPSNNRGSLAQQGTTALFQLLINVLDAFAHENVFRADKILVDNFYKTLLSKTECC